MKLNKVTSDALDKSGWFDVVRPVLESEEYQTLRKILVEQMKIGQVYPRPEHIFRSLIETPYDSIKVVILGQDPYHGPNQATGLAFGVNNGMPIPPSLRNIFKEIEREFGCFIPKNVSDLTGWAQQGVLLLNSVLTVEHGNPNSHAGLGWEKLTDYIISTIGQRQNDTVFMLWGDYAKKKAKLLPKRGAYVLETTHPSPLSFHKGFLGCDHFSTANTFLITTKRTPIDWTRISANQTNSDIGNDLKTLGLLR